MFLIDQIQHTSALPFRSLEDAKKAATGISVPQLADFYTTHQTLMQALRITYIDRTNVSFVQRPHVILTIPRSIRVKNQQVLQVLEILSRCTARESSEGELVYFHGVREEYMVLGGFKRAAAGLLCYSQHRLVLTSALPLQCDTRPR